MSFPYLSDVIRAATGYELALPFATFGLLVGGAMLAGAACLGAELRRLHAAGRMPLARPRIRGAQGEAGKPPHAIVPDFTVAVMLAGVIGARLFHILEHVDAFAASPWEMIFSRSGFSVFGGLIFGGVAGAVFMRRWSLPLRPICDAAAPALMLGYAIGRIGCQVSGDGDWGIAADMALKPGWLPTWLWAQTYTNNIVGAVIPPPGVYPTPLYETAMGLAAFGLLWALRRHPFGSGWLFALYLLLAGLERLLIEQIRVNPVMHIRGLHATQAEIVAALLVSAGAAGIVILGRRRGRPIRLARRPLHDQHRARDLLRGLLLHDLHGDCPPVDDGLRMAKEEHGGSGLSR
jgi:phosphatidylglycerol:prolipoprotein diacylglycerol transferase